MLRMFILVLQIFFVAMRLHSGKKLHRQQPFRVNFSLMLNKREWSHPRKSKCESISSRTVAVRAGRFFLMLLMLAYRLLSFSESSWPARRYQCHARLSHCMRNEERKTEWKRQGHKNSIFEERDYFSVFSFARSFFSTNIPGQRGLWMACVI